jgi:hypothetical protein
MAIKTRFSAPQTMDLDTRRMILATLSQPTNPVAGAVLSHIDTRAHPSAIREWERNGWIKLTPKHYILTTEGHCALLSARSGTPPESFYPAVFNWTD